MASKYFIGYDNSSAGTTDTNWLISGTTTNATASSSISMKDVEESYKRLYDPRGDYASHQRLRSGVWRKNYCHESGVEKWTIDLALLDEKLRELMVKDPAAWRMFSTHPNRTLDSLFGEGTSKAYFTKRHSPYDTRISMHMDRHFGYDPMPPITTPPKKKGREPLVRIPHRIAFGGVSVPFKLRGNDGRQVKSVIDDGGNLLGSLEYDSKLWLKPQLKILRESL